MQGRRPTKPEQRSVQDTETSYEKLMARLAAVVDRLETGNLPLAEALGLYEEGVTLGAACQRMLDAAELRVQRLSVTEEGVAVEDWNETQPGGET